MWFLFSLFSILAWSGSDLFSKMGSKKDDKYSHWKMVIAVGIVMGLHAIYEMTLGGVVVTWNTILTYLPVSLLYISSMVLGYAGLRYIELSISSPICNSSGAVASLLCFIFLHQTMNGLQFVGVALLCLGIIAFAVLERQRAADEIQTEIAAHGKKYSDSFLAILFPILYCILDGLGTFADALVLDSGMLEERPANVAYELTFLFMAAVAFIYVQIIKKEKIMLSREKPKFLAAVCETAGQFTYVFAIAANAILAAPMIASYCIFSVLWSHLFLKERLSKKHYVVIAAVMVGIFILGME